MKWKAMVAAAAVGFLLVSCGDSGKDVEFDIHALAEELNTGITYQDPLEKLDDDMVGLLYAVDGLVEDSVVYMGSGATAEEIAVFACNDTETARDEVEPIVKEHIESQITSFENYVPEEVAKLKDAVVRQAGKYVAVSVSNDPNTAKEIMDRYMK